MLNLVVIGLGHVGGSVAKAARERGIAGRVTGVETDPAHREKARAARLATSVVGEIGDFARDADLVVIATPPGAVPACAIAALKAAPRAVVTDVAGVKAAIVAAVREGAGEGGARFVGGHPMAGTAGRGPDSADAALFEGRHVILTPTETTSPHALSAAEGFWRGLGATPIRETPEAHDRAIAAVSHLPHAIAFALTTAAAELCGDASRVSGPSFESATRVAASDPSLWAELFTANREAVLAALSTFRTHLDALESALRPPLPTGGGGGEGAAPTTSLLAILSAAQRLKTGSSS